MKDRFVFYSKSADKAPGKGSNEQVEDATAYTKLASIKDWRRILGNFYECNFIYEGRTYRTVEHALQAKKFEPIDKQLFESFALESNSELSKSDGLAARRMRKTIRLNPQQLQKWDQSKIGHVANMHRAKFSQCPKAKQVLLATGEAELWHYLSRQPKGKNLQHWDTLEEVRSKLRLTK
ncbi:MAG: NADAR family protein [Saprospiraceae bacterium]|nr:NADAR family protein [Saprospiraceae bacterium]